MEGGPEAGNKGAGRLPASCWAAHTPLLCLRSSGLPWNECLCYKRPNLKFLSFAGIFKIFDYSAVILNWYVSGAEIVG